MPHKLDIDKLITHIINVGHSLPIEMIIDCNNIYKIEFDNNHKIYQLYFFKTFILLQKMHNSKVMTQKFIMRNNTKVMRCNGYNIYI